jgi:hypothetical protein
MNSSYNFYLNLLFKKVKEDRKKDEPEFEASETPGLLISKTSCKMGSSKVQANTRGGNPGVPFSFWDYNRCRCKRSFFLGDEKIRDL